jgi:hypothetical protein
LEYERTNKSHIRSEDAAMATYLLKGSVGPFYFRLGKEGLEQLLHASFVFT